MPAVETFLSQHPWYTLFLGMALPWIALYVVASLVTGSASDTRKTEDARPTGRVASGDIWARVVCRVRAGLREGRLDPAGCIASFLTATSLASDEGRRVRVLVEWVQLHGLSLWNGEHAALLRRALAEEGRAGTSVLFEATVAPGAVWSWAPDLGPDWVNPDARDAAPGRPGA